MSASKAFISSTSVDLPEYRQAVIEACLGRGYFPVGMEHWSAKDADAVTVCLSELEDCQLFIGIYAFRYGWIPPGRNVSICELEYDRAKEKGIPRLLFFADENAAWPPKMVDKGDNAVKLEAFKERIGAERVGAFFGSNHELRAEVVQALADWKSTHLNPNHVATPRKGQEIPPRPEHGTGDSAKAQVDQTGLTPLQEMLLGDLRHLWQKVSVLPQAKNLNFFQALAEKSDSDAVFDLLLADINRSSVRVLSRLNECYRDSTIERGGPIFQIVRSIALVAAEKFLAEQSGKKEIFADEPHRPIPEQDPRIAAVVAAAIFRFALHFKPDNPAPINVVDSKLPQSEFGNPGEQGIGLARNEVYSAARRINLGEDLEPLDTSLLLDEVIQVALADARELLGCPMVLGVGLTGDATHPLASEDARKQLIREMERHGVPVFFRTQTNTGREQEIEKLMNSLIQLINHFLPSTKIPPLEPKTMDDKTSPAATHINTQININGAGNTVAQATGPNSVVAGHDVIQGVQSADLAGLLSQLSQVIAAHPVLAADPGKRKAWSEHVEDIEVVTKKPESERTPTDARTVKRALEALKTGAEAIDQGKSIVEKLTPVWTGLAYAWPALANLLS